MDYKTNILKEALEIKSDLLPEINGLHFGIMGEGKAVFDYTAYFEENDLKPIDYKVFMRLNKYWIETLIKPSGKRTSEIFFQNTDGHILVAAELAFLFLAFSNPELCVYFNNIVTDAVSDGVAYSTGLVYSLAAERLPTEDLQDIIKSRQNDTGSE